MIEFRVGKLAAKLGVHRNTVSNWIRGGKIRARPTVGKRYLVEEEELRRFWHRYSLPEEIFQELASSGKLPAGGFQSSVAETQNHDLRKSSKEVKMTGRTIGSVMVVGGGIAGIQATLDLADSGFRVYLVEKSSGIGGAMAQLDKTFPTNDCAM